MKDVTYFEAMSWITDYLKEHPKTMHSDFIKAFCRHFKVDYKTAYAHILKAIEDEVIYRYMGNTKRGRESWFYIMIRPFTME